MKNIEVNKDLCIGCGTCTALCPNVFEMEDGKAVVVSKEFKECNSEEVIDSCPVNAISVKE